MGRYPFYIYSNVPYYKRYLMFEGVEYNEFKVWMDKTLKALLTHTDKKSKVSKAHRKRYYRYQLYIQRVVIPELIMEHHDSIEDFIIKNNHYIKMGKEVILNLTTEDIEVIKQRWADNIKANMKQLKIDKDMGVGPVDLMLTVLKCRGNLSECARKLKISRLSIKKLIEGNKTLFAIYLEIEQLILDYVEYQLQQKIDEGDRMAIQYYLNAKGGERGFGSYEARRRVAKTIRGESLRDDDFQLD